MPHRRHGCAYLCYAFHVMIAGLFKANDDQNMDFDRTVVATVVTAFATKGNALASTSVGGSERSLERHDEWIARLSRTFHKSRACPRTRRERECDG